MHDCCKLLDAIADTIDNHIEGHRAIDFARRGYYQRHLARAAAAAAIDVLVDKGHLPAASKCSHTQAV
ncbi:hypothetical protein I5J36_gp65 [Mycobacterium phage Mendokysei]|uniref:Uncharacterized protein n=1 Tax=Mycobacterium phage Mendokysei TaxID=2099637 RepID=A0A2P1CGB6_9CAUD|nr:hypothetical protein I5J36_gp65 [Mycobacterium phage Mendokysei]AVJ50280.1 hypothetical protein SEA_MENDOKYSEI_65 [Mycobacterium phage Mendokysei]